MHIFNKNLQCLRPHLTFSAFYIFYSSFGINVVKLLDGVTYQAAHIPVTFSFLFKKDRLDQGTL